MLKFLEFLKNLFFKGKKVYCVKDMEFISSTIDDNGVEHIIHGNNDAKVTLSIKRDEDKGEGVCNLVADKNVHINEEDIVWLLKRYL